jgi:hypothetical protein
VRSRMVWDTASCGIPRRVGCRVASDQERNICGGANKQMRRDPMRACTRPTEYLDYLEYPWSTR